MRLGHKNVSKYSWEKTAAGTLAVYERAYNRNKTTTLHRNGRLK